MSSLYTEIWNDARPNPEALGVYYGSHGRVYLNGLNELAAMANAMSLDTCTLNFQGKDYDIEFHKNAEYYGAKSEWHEDRAKIIMTLPYGLLDFCPNEIREALSGKFDAKEISRDFMAIGLEMMSAEQRLVRMAAQGVVLPHAKILYAEARPNNIGRNLALTDEIDRMMRFIQS